MEKIIVTVLAVVALLSTVQILQSFYREHTEILPAEGGIYTEGAVGKVELINPLFVRQGSVTHDLSQLIFSGLTKYDSATGELVADLANYKMSADGKTYTFVIKEGAKWQDGQPVTSDDILFTYNSVLNSPAFRGAILTYNDYKGIKVAKIDERTVEFLLEKPDSFFLVKTLTGILPQHLLADQPVETLDQSFFNQFPIGSGRYKMISVTPFEDFAEVSLEANEDFYDGPPNISTIVLRVFPTFKELLKNVSELDGIRQVPDEFADKVLAKDKFTLERYNLPQYVALFINTSSEKLQEDKVRLALQLGTNKDEILDVTSQSIRVDTPLLEIDGGSWVFKHDVKKANGALFDTEWKLPSSYEDDGAAEEEIVDQRTVAERIEDGDTSDVEYINSPNGGSDWKTTDNKVTITGTVPKDTKAVIIDDYELKKYVPGDKGWSYVASEAFDNLKPGKNVFKLYTVNFKEEKELVDAITIQWGDQETFAEDETEERLADNEAAPELEIRINEEGEELRLKLVTSSTPESYAKIAEAVQEQWKKIGVAVDVEVLDNGAFQKKLSTRDYDLLIFGQNLGYNLDAYPYWHSSQAKEGGYNLSEFKNFIVDSLLEKARREHDGEDRLETLSDIQEIMRSEVPAVFLYSPTYQVALSQKVQNANLTRLATTSDRFANIEDWFATGKKKFKEGVNPFTFFGWIFKQF